MRQPGQFMAALLLWLVWTAPGSSAASRFAVYDLWIDPLGEPLAAYQVQVSAGSRVKIISVEGGAHPAFAEPPFYDPKAIQKEVIILAAFNTGAETRLPAQRTRVASLHMQIEGDQPPKFTVRLLRAANQLAKPIRPTLTLTERPE